VKQKNAQGSPGQWASHTSRRIPANDVEGLNNHFRADPHAPGGRS
jgi:hypothetical protein